MRPDEHVPRRARKGLVLSAAILASGIGFLMTSGMNIAVPTIQRYFAADIGRIQWILNAYTLSLGSLILASGSLIDRFGLRRIYLSGMYLFLIGSLLCATAWNIGSLILFRALQGVGAALMIPGSLAAIKRTYPSSAQGRAIGLWAGISGAIAGLGPFVGGYLTEWSWRYLFVAMIPLAAGAVFMTARALPGREPVDVDFGDTDYPGFLLNVAGLGLLTYGLIRVSEGQSLAVSLVSAGIGGALLVGFAGLEKSRSRRGRESLVPPAIFSPKVRTANLSTFFLYFSFSGVLFLLSLNLQQLQGYRPGYAGLLIMPATILITLLSGPSGTLTDRVGPEFQLRAGPMIFALGAILLLQGGVDADYAAAFLPGMLLLGLGMVLIIPAVTASAIDVPVNLVGAASGVNNAAARIAGLFAVTVSGAVLAGGYRILLSAALDRLGLDRELIGMLMSNAGRMLDAPLPDSLSSRTGSAVQSAMRSAYAGGYRAALGINILSAAAAAVVGWRGSFKGDD